MQYISTQKYIRVSPRKLREVVHVVRKLSPVEAVEVLPHIQKRANVIMFKALKVAIANAVNKGATLQNLGISEFQVNEGPRLKRYRPGSRGVAKPYQKRMSHLRIVLTTLEKGEKFESKSKERKFSKQNAKTKDKKSKLQSKNNNDEK